ncbi:MAG: hypothetical protein ACOCYV_02320 [Planctomycetota bacterium]
MLCRCLFLLALLVPLSAAEPLAIALPKEHDQGDPWLELGRVLRRHGDARLIRDAVVDADLGLITRLSVALPEEILHGVIVLDIPAEVEREAVVERYRALRQAVAQSAASGISWHETGLGLRAPQQYRQEVLQAITDDIGRITAGLGPDYAAEIQGLSAPVAIRPHAGLDLRLSIPYTIRIHRPESDR